ncbi:MAG: hypothetical protein ABWY39_06150 [Mycobacterium sp.]
MRRTVAVIWHASFCIAAGVLYFFFVLPRWPELLGKTSPTLGTVLRIVTGALIGLAALPVVFTVLRTRRPEYGTPQLALTLRTSSVGLHVLAAVLFVGTAISEIWLDLDSAGQWMFGIYGAAAAIALLGMFAFYLAFVAELPPPPPKPLKPKQKKQRRGRKTAEASVDGATSDEATTDDDETPAEITADAESEPAAEEVTSTAQQARQEPPIDEDKPVAQEDPDTDEAAATAGGLRNRRPSGKSSSSRRRRRSRGGVAVED